MKSSFKKYILLILLFPIVSLSYSQVQELSDSIYISDIQISGNRKTKDFVILRELPFKEGDFVTSQDLKKLLNESRINLLKTPLFNYVEPTAKNIDTSHVKIIIKVTERWYLWPQASLYYADRNFSNWLKEKDFTRTDLGLGFIKYNFRGRNEKISFFSIFGYDEELILNYENFHFDSSQKHSGAVYLKRLKRKETGCMIENDRLKRIKLTDNYALTTYNISFRYQYRKKISTSHSAYFGYEHRSLSDSLLFCNPFYSINPDVPVNYFYLKYIFWNDKRDSRVFPLTGHQIKITAIKNGLFIFHNSNINSFKIKGELSKYTKLNPKLFLNNHFSFQKTTGRKNPFFLKTALGYSSNIRSYEYFAINGEDFVLLKNTLNVELLPKKTFYIKFIRQEQFNKPFIRIFADVFADFAYVRNTDTHYSQSNVLVNTPLLSGGAGINILSWYDWLIRLEYSVNIQRNKGFYLHFEAPF